MTLKQKRDRLKWAKDHQNWDVEKWNNIHWSDESRFEVCVGDSRSRVIRQKHETYHADCLKRKVKFPASVMVWGSMSARGVGKLHFINGIVNSDKYIDILENSLLPTLEESRIAGNEFIFQQDGAACHTSKKSTKWLSENEIPLLKWVSSSPDLSPIETLWHVMKKRLRANPARSVQELRERLQNIWDNFTPEECQNLVNTLPRRIRAVIQNKGDVTQW